MVRKKFGGPPPRGAGGNYIFSKKIQSGGVPNKNFRHFPSTFTLISAHTNFHDPRTTPSVRKVREGERETNNGVNRGHYVLHQRVQRQTLAHALKKILELSEMARTFNEKFLGQPLLGEK